MKTRVTERNSMPVRILPEDMETLATLGRAVGAGRVNVLHALMTAIRTLTPEQQVELVRRHYQRPVCGGLGEGAKIQQAKERA